MEAVAETRAIKTNARYRPRVAVGSKRSGRSTFDFERLSVRTDPNARSDHHAVNCLYCLR